MSPKKSGKIVHPKSYLANLANMKLLASDAEFQAIVKDARAKLGIPEAGLALGDELQEWYGIHYKASDAVIMSPEYNERGRAIFADRDTGCIDQNEFDRRLDLHEDEVPLNYFRFVERFIIDKFDLPENYEDCINQYVLTGTINAPYHNFVVSTVLERGNRIPRKSTVTFFTVPTEEDMQLAKRAIDWHAKFHGMRQYQPMKNIDRDLKIEAWYRHKDRFDPVEQKSYKTATSEIAKEHLGSAKKADAVRFIVKDLEKARKRRLRARGKS